MGSLEQDDDELRTIMDYFFNEIGGDMPSFHKFLDYRLASPDWGHACATFDMRDDFVGNLVHRTLQGGVVASMLDIVGGHAVFLSVFQHLKGQPFEKQFKSVRNIGSIDLRVDYLRPGKGRQFTAIASILRTGRKVAVARMELHNEEQRLIAVGTGTYTVG